MNRATLPVLSVLIVAAVLLNGAGVSVRFATGTPSTNPAASKPPTSQPSYPIWDGKESVADYAKRAGIKDAQITLALDGNVMMKLTLIPAGKFLMGGRDSSSIKSFKDEGPTREVTISRPFYMGVYEVTQAQYEPVVGRNPSNFKDPSNPVESVSWKDAVDFCKKLSEKAGKRVRLPTEGEWEYACRAGSKTDFCCGDGYDSVLDYAWCSINSGKKTHPVGRKKSNAWGLFDMHGNVSEWCSDYFAHSYADAKTLDPEGPRSGTSRVSRGGGWSSGPQFCRSSNRSGLDPEVQLREYGFRVVLDLK